MGRGTRGEIRGEVLGISTRSWCRHVSWCSTRLGRCYTCLVPTTRPRHFVTETDDVAVALDAAARRWPDLSRAQLLVRLALEGHHSAQQAHEDRRRRRLEAVRKHSGTLTGAYGPDYREHLRDEWPA